MSQKVCLGDEKLLSRVYSGEKSDNGDESGVPCLVRHNIVLVRRNGVFIFHL